VAAGVALFRGIDHLKVTPGQPPEVAFELDGECCQLIPRIVIGADGRSSTVARQTGFARLSDPIHHLFTGLLVEKADEWPPDEQSIGVDGDVGFYVLPQGSGRIRLYLAHSLDQRNRFAGSDGIQRFLKAFDRQSLPYGKHLAGAQVAGPCNGYPNNELWIDRPVIPGIVLIGDAAGYSDPAGGQGISTAFSDVRLVSEILNGTTKWIPESFDSYVIQRRERTRRIRFSNQLLATFRMEFTEEARQRRARGRAKMQSNSELTLPFLAFQKGPFSVPAEAFGETIWKELVE
jgi:2-polyprenyl-6-methoxyphenol hydroxylase-like FAD-dependent oxidoreductase